MMISPLHDLILIRPDEPERVTTMGIVIPANAAADKHQVGTALALGPGRTLDNGIIVPIDLDVGDSVIFDRYAGSNVEVDGEKLLLIHEAEILAVLG